MKIGELLLQAEATIGKAKEGDQDWVIAPTKHADQYRESATTLSEVLSSSRILGTAKQFEESDREAIMAQDLFKKIARRANLAVFCTACLGALILVVNGSDLPVKSDDFEQYRKSALLILGVGALLAGSLGTMSLYQIQTGKLLEVWMSRRARAETHRHGLFELATRAPDQSKVTSKILLPLLQLEYFRRYQLDVQIAYYRSARQRHETAAHRILVVSGIAVFLGTIATGLSGILGSFVPGFAGFAALGVIGVALSTYAVTKEGIGQDRRNAERYDRTADALAELRKKLDDVRRAAAKDNREPMERFVAAVHEHLSLEHRQWLKAAENTQESITRLQESIEKHKSSLGNSED